MSPADDPIEQLRHLPPVDRDAVLTHLTPAERARLAVAMDAPAASPFASDIAARIADPGATMTAAGRAALLAAAGQVAPRVVPKPSLFGRLRAAIGGR